MNQCEGVRIVRGDEAPLGGVAQVVFHGAPVVEIDVLVLVHEEGEKEKDGEVQMEVKGEVEENQRQPHMWDMRMTWDERLKDNLSQCGCDVSVRSTNTKQRAVVLSPTCCACWCTPCHCCHCPHWSWRCCCRYILLRSHFCSWFSVSGDVLFTPTVGDSRLRWLLPI